MADNKTLLQFFRVNALPEEGVVGGLYFVYDVTAEGAATQHGVLYVCTGEKSFEEYTGIKSASYDSAAYKLTINPAVGDAIEVDVKDAVLDNSLYEILFADGLQTGEVVTDPKTGKRSVTLGHAAKRDVATTIADKTTATDDKLATEKAVRTELDKIDARITEMGNVLELKGVVSTETYPSFPTTKDAEDNIIIVIPTEIYPVNEETGVQAQPENGDVVIYGNEEYMWMEGAWHEIGQVKTDEAVTTLQIADASKTYLSVGEKDVANGAVTLTADVANTKEAVAEATAEDDKLVSAIALQQVVEEVNADILANEQVTAAALNDLNERLTEVEGVSATALQEITSDGKTLHVTQEEGSTTVNVELAWQLF